MVETGMTARWLRTGTVLVVLGALIACTPNRPASTAAGTGGTDPGVGQTAAAPTATTGPASPDAQGIISYDGYQTARARDGDTVATVASRIGLSATALGAYNGLAADQSLRAGDELALPPRPGGYGDAGAQVAASAPTGPTSSDLPAAGQQQLGTTAPSGAGGVPVTPEGTLGTPGATTGTGWSPEIAEAAIARSSGISQDGSLGPPPSSAQPVPDGPIATPELDSPDLGQYQTQASQTPEVPVPPTPTSPSGATTTAAVPQMQMQRPVDGPIAVGFNKGTGPARNDGIDFAAPAGAPVVAAADGEVALVSESLGGLGTIVLVRHPNEILTVYGRIDQVAVQRGDLVQAGQQIGVVSDAAAPAEPRMHFEVRRGSESLDPSLFL
ncbi:MAG: LysM peptidoglycan-binding domain-containing M23 family metallopeptidase [Pseudomonadota bacterium]